MTHSRLSSALVATRRPRIVCRKPTEVLRRSCRRPSRRSRPELGRNSWGPWIAIHEDTRILSFATSYGPQRPHLLGVSIPSSLKRSPLRTGWRSRGPRGQRGGIGRGFCEAAGQKRGSEDQRDPQPRLGFNRQCPRGPAWAAVHGLEHGRFPHEWRRSSLVLLRKEGRLAESLSAYRPICS